MTDTDKPKRLYYKSYIKMINNSVGTNLFRNFYVSTPTKGEFDALADGYNSCAFYVSGLLVIFKKISSIHGTVDSTIRDLEESNWHEVAEPRIGDVLVWEPKKFPEGWNKHIGFYIGGSDAISTSVQKKVPVRHDISFGSEKRKIIKTLRMSPWD